MADRAEKTWTPDPFDDTLSFTEVIDSGQYGYTWLFNEIRMTRRYTLNRRAEQQARTRRRIVEATVALHGTVGPARTTFSMVAERAGVQRKTLYAHFPDEPSLFQACSAHHLEQHPPPNPSAWAEVADRPERARTALLAIYEWYEAHAGLIAAVLRDAEHHEGTREITRLRLGPCFAAWEASLRTDRDSPTVAALIGLALSFHTWRTLTVERGLATTAAAAAMASAITSAGSA